jgi:hypothetical protein
VDWTANLTKLRELLANLYSAPDSAKRIVDDVGLDKRRIRFENAAINIWHDILDEAVKHNKLIAIVELAHQEYPNDEQVPELLHFFQTNTKDPPSDKQIAKVQRDCDKLLTALTDTSYKKVLTALEKWLYQTTQVRPGWLGSPIVQSLLLQVYPEAVKTFVTHARNNLRNFKDLESIENRVCNGLVELFQIFLELDTDLRQPLDDLQLAVTCLFHTEPFRLHEFVNAFFAGVYANHAWTEATRRTEIAQMLADITKDAPVGDDIYCELLAGAFICEQIVPTSVLHSPTLLSEVADDYVTQHSRETYRGRFAWWEGVTSAIDEIDHTKTDFTLWCEEKRSEKARYEYNKQWIESGLPPRRALWPLELLDKTNNRASANYDFPSTPGCIDEIAIQPSYFFVHSYKTREISAFDICNEYLSHRNHHVITGNLRAGKSWLRLYLEYFCLATDGKVLPLFYFAPASLAYEPTVSEIVENLVRSVANQLFADLLMRSSNRTLTNDDRWRTSRAAIVQFLGRYSYTLPDNHNSLAQPIPPAHLLDIELAFGNSYLGAVYTQMKQRIDDVAPSLTIATGIDEILGHIQHAIELVDYQQIFVLVDNWDHLSAPSRRRLSSYLLQSGLLDQLCRRGIFLKLFVPEMADSAVAQFDKTCELRRESLHTLTLYTYCEANAEPKSLQTTTVGS